MREFPRIGGEVIRMSRNKGSKAASESDPTPDPFGALAGLGDLPAGPDLDLRLATDRIDMQTPLNFVCTVDSTGGNSGSPVINARAELVGLLFDGNIESLANEFLYGERVERSVCVHPQAIVEALRKVYRAPRLLRELAR